MANIVDTGTILEDYLGSISVVPPHVKRHLNLIYDLECKIDGNLKKIKAIVSSGNVNQDKINALAEEVEVLGKEKISITNQISSIVSRQLGTVTHNLEKMEKLLLSSKQISEDEVFRVNSSAEKAYDIFMEQFRVTAKGNPFIYSKKSDRVLSSPQAASPILPSSSYKFTPSPVDRPTNLNKPDRMPKLEIKDSAAPVLFQNSSLLDIQQQTKYSISASKAQNQPSSLDGQSAVLFSPQGGIKRLGVNLGVKPPKKTRTYKPRKNSKEPKAKKLTKTAIQRLLGKDVAAFVKGENGFGVTEELWILCKVLKALPYDPKQPGSKPRVEIVDLDNPKQKYVLPAENLTPLPNLKTVEAVTKYRQDLEKCVEKIIYSMYPDSTTFYKSILKKVAVEHEIGLVCFVNFFDDQDQTGNTPLRKIIASHTFISPAYQMQNLITN
eukprot:augustus_masked-scaffold_3-processed-gene-4.43-mRNA-1 protein AED:1.00 eAED:1.00 QI:0/-1/0/0/-1/1/1/0/437